MTKLKPRRGAADLDTTIECVKEGIEQAKRWVSSRECWGLGILQALTLCLQVADRAQAIVRARDAGLGVK